MRKSVERKRAKDGMKEKTRIEREKEKRIEREKVRGKI